MVHLKLTSRERIFFSMQWDCLHTARVGCSFRSRGLQKAVSLTWSSAPPIAGTLLYSTHSGSGLSHGILTPNAELWALHWA